MDDTTSLRKRGIRASNDPPLDLVVSRLEVHSFGWPSAFSRLFWESSQVHCPYQPDRFYGLPDYISVFGDLQDVVQHPAKDHSGCPLYFFGNDDPAISGVKRSGVVHPGSRSDDSLKIENGGSEVVL